MTNINVCSEESCTETRSRSKLCEKHYMRLYRARRRVQDPTFADAERSYARAYRERLKASDPEQYIATVRETNLRVNYGVTVEWFEATLYEQDFRCAICKRHESEFVKRFAVDHDHACCPGNKSCGECIRGLLCISCNNGLGRFNDDLERMESAVSYLRESSRKSVN